MRRSTVVICACAALGAAALFASRGTSLRHAAPTTPRLVAQAAARPLAFERNDGQTDPRAAFVARADGAAVFVERDGLVVRPRGDGRASMRLSFDGGGASRVEGTERLDGHVNYLKGSDPSKWLADVPLFGRAVCRGAWPGIDVAFHGDGRSLEYDLDVAPGADPSAIRLRFDGADSAVVRDDGNLAVRVGRETFTNLRPRAFQDGREIAGSFVSLADGVVGFAVVGRDASRALVIDPVVAFATYVGGTGDETPSDVAVDAAGNSYVTGAVVSIDYPLANELPGTSGGAGVDAFVTKLNPSGAKFLYSTYLGGNGSDAGWGIRVDATGIYVAGSTTSPDFPAVAAYQKTLAGGFVEGDAFLTKLAPTGDAILYSTYFGGAGDDGCRAIAVDKSGAVVLGGFTSSTDLPTTSGAGRRTISGAGDGWVAKFASDGASLAWSTYVGGSSATEAVQGVGVDGSQNVFACGFTGSTDLPLGAGGFKTRPGGGRIDGFLVKLDSHGVTTAGTYVGGIDDDSCRRVAVDAFGFPYVAGFTLSGDLPVVAAVQGYFAGGIGTGDGFVAEFGPSLVAPVFLTYFGGTSDDDVQGLALGADGSVYVAGGTTASTFPLVAPAQPAFGGARDAFAAKLAPGGASIVWSTYVGGPGVETAKALAVDARGGAYVAVSSQDGGLPTFCAAQSEFAGGHDDVYVVKLTEDVSSVPASPLAPAATAASGFHVDLSWTDASENECGFRVERRTNDGPFEVVANLDTNVVAFADVGVAPDTSYVYRVVAVNPLGESLPSEEASVATPGTVVVSPRRGSLIETPRAKLDSIRMTSVLRFNQFSKGRLAVPAETLEIDFGAAADPVRVVIPAGDKRWRRRGRTTTWTSAPKTRPVVRVDVRDDGLTSTMTWRASRFDFPTTPQGSVFFSIRTDAEAGHVERAFTSIKRRPGRYRLP